MNKAPTYSIVFIIVCTLLLVTYGLINKDSETEFFVVNKINTPLQKKTVIDLSKHKYLRIYPEKYELKITNEKDTVFMLVDSEKFKSIDIGDYITYSK